MNRGLRVLSLFDGISCGKVALDRVGVKIEKYYASEIEPSAIKISQKNHKDIIQLGDIRDLTIDILEGIMPIDIIIGGSPCQSFSFAGKGVGMATKDRVDITTLEQYLELKENKFEFEGHSYLFWEYIRILEEVKPKYFLLENVKMAEKWKDVITKSLGVDPIMIDSKLVSAQSRERFYWSNITDIVQPEDKHIYIDDIVQNEIDHKLLSRTRLDYDNYDKSKVDKSIHKNTATQIGNSRKFGNSVRSNGKAFTLRRINPNGVIDENYNIREFTPVEAERLQTLPDNYTDVDGIKKRQRYEAVGNGWTVDVIVHILKGLKSEYI